MSDLADLYSGLIEFQRNAPTIKKSIGVDFTHNGTRFKYSYAPLDAILEAVRKPLADAGLGFTQLVEGAALVTRLVHKSGQHIESRLDLALAGKSPQQQGSLISYAKRYGISAILGIATEDDDDGQAAEEAHRKTSSPSAPSNGSKLSRALSASVNGGKEALLPKESRQARPDSPAKPEHLADVRFRNIIGEDGRPLNLFKKSATGAAAWARMAVKECVEPLFVELDAIQTLDELLALPESEDSKARLDACAYGVPAWYDEWVNRYNRRKKELEIAEFKQRETAFVQ